MYRVGVGATAAVCVIVGFFVVSLISPAFGAFSSWEDGIGNL